MDIDYNVPMTQIQALIGQSESCEQEIQFTCLGTPLRFGSTNYGYWLDKNGKKRYYFHGNATEDNICKCGYDNSCETSFDTTFDCNCNAGLPRKTEDRGLITDNRELPITSFVYGPIRRNSGKSAKIKIGPLRCKGKRVILEKENAHFAVQRGCVNGHRLKAVETITYDKIFIDNYNKFDISNGIFTVPVTGIYALNFSGHKGWRNDIQSKVGFLVNGVYKNSFGIRIGKDSYASLSYRWYASLVKGDKIKLETYSGQINVQCTQPVMFSGHLIKSNQ